MFFFLKLSFYFEAMGLYNLILLKPVYLLTCYDSVSRVVRSANRGAFFNARYQASLRSFLIWSIDGR